MKVDLRDPSDLESLRVAAAGSFLRCRGRGRRHDSRSHRISLYTAPSVGSAPNSSRRIRRAAAP
ncbi:MAG TPA: hypothetical protein VF796_15215, partial [Humisphaera sp.]